MTQPQSGTEASTTGRIGQLLPITTWLPAYDRSWLRRDIIAGLTVWALMVPTSMGYATISGVPVQYGLYAAMVGLVGFALFTTSRQVTQGPSSSTAAVLGAAVLGVAAAGSDKAIAMASAIVLVTGLLFVVMYLLKMGWVSAFLSASVLTGFTFGVAINVAAGELFKITGTPSGGTNTWQKLWTWLTTLPATNVPTLVVGLVALALVFGIKLLSPRAPGALIAVALGIAATSLLGLADMDVELIAAVPRGLPSLALPSPSFIVDNLAMIMGAAVGLLLVGFSVTTAAVREYANKHNYRIDINQELLAQGVSNLASGLVQGVFDNGSLSKSPVNDDAGAQSQLSNLAQAAFIMLTLLFLAPLFSALPEAVLGAIIIEAVVMGMMDVGEMRRLFRVKRVEFLAALAALLGVMTFGILQGVVIGVALSLVWLVAASALPYIPELGRKPDTRTFVDLREHPDGQTFAGLSILRFDGGLFFVNAGALGDRLREVRVQHGEQLNGVILSMEGVDFIDIEGADVLKKVANVGKELDIDLHLARVKPQVMAVIERDGTADVIGRDRIHDDIAAAVEMHLRSYSPASSDSEAPGQ